ncbi:MAG: CPBP family intramembrane glutamic endopeptidase [Steroidobacteraceae bacterium]
MRTHAKPTHADEPRQRSLAPQNALAVALYALIVSVLWIAAHAYGVAKSLNGHLLGPFIAVALMLAVLWTFGWGASGPIAHWLSSAPACTGGARPARYLAALSIARVLMPGLFCAGVYLLIAVPIGEFSDGSLLLYFAFPAVLAAILEYLPPAEKLGWQDVIVLAALGCAVEYGWLQRSISHPGLGMASKFLLTEVALYLYLVQRRLPGVGFDLRLRLRDLAIGVCEWAFFVPIGIGLGFALGFLRFHDRLPAAGTFAGTLLVTFLFVAIPEELFFRGLVQNLLETRLSRGQALALASIIFGLSHYIHGPVFNWRYVILATIAGVFYGRAWRRDRRLGASAISHTLVDTVWVTWFLA